MPLYISRGRYNAETINRLMAKPEDRGGAVDKLLRAVGGRVHALYYTLGEYDFLLIAEAPSEKDVIAALLAAASSGGVENLNTTVAITSAEMTDVFARAASVAGQFRPGGA